MKTLLLITATLIFCTFTRAMVTNTQHNLTSLATEITQEHLSLAMSLLAKKSYSRSELNAALEKAQSGKQRNLTLLETSSCTLQKQSALGMFMGISMLVISNPRMRKNKEYDRIIQKIHQQLERD